ncbi:MAG: hypothetical protein GF350_00090 [Chitinivibrionales bacterium]|nr:hypothetical protein [Chitinivibrionales bacterium]
MMPAKTNSFVSPIILFIMHAAVLSAAESSVGPWRILASRDTLDIYIQDRRVGSMIHSVGIDDDAGVIEKESRVVVDPPGSITGLDKLNIYEARRYDFTGALREAQQILKTPAGGTSWKLTKKNGWRLAITTGGRETLVNVDSVHENLAASRRIMTGIKNRTIDVGDVWHDTLFELISGTGNPVKTTCMEIPGAGNGFRYRFVDYDILTDKKLHWETDTAGNLLVQEIPPHFVARSKSDLDDADNNSRARSEGHSVDFAELTKIPMHRPPDKNETVALQLASSITLDSTVYSFYQKKDSLWLLRQLSEKCRDRGGKLSRELEKFTRPTIVLQSDHPKIHAVSDSLCAGVNSVCEKISKCTGHVFSHLEKRNTASFSNAIETLRSGFGDCSEHAVLCAALLRAQKIPARVVYGLYYGSSQKGYLYHAWVVVYNGGLLFADPAHGIFPAPGNRVPLMIDDTGRKMVLLMRVVDRVTVRYVGKDGTTTRLWGK